MKYFSVSQFRGYNDDPKVCVIKGGSCGQCDTELLVRLGILPCIPNIVPKTGRGGRAGRCCRRFWWCAVLHAVSFIWVIKHTLCRRWWVFRVRRICKRFLQCMDGFFKCEIIPMDGQMEAFWSSKPVCETSDGEGEQESQRHSKERVQWYHQSK